jgi:hypothetical protein
MNISNELCKDLLRQIVLAAFNYGQMENVDLVYPIKMITKQQLENIIDKWLSTPIKTIKIHPNFVICRQ